VAVDFLGLELRRPVEVLFVLLGFWFLFTGPRPIKRSVPVLLMGLTTVVLTISWLMMVVDHPERARSGPSLEDVLDKFIFVFFALALAGLQLRIKLFTCFVVLLIVLMPWLMGEGAAAFQAGLAGGRQGFGISPIRTAMYFCLVFIFALTFLKETITGSDRCWRRAFLLFVLLVYALVCILFAQTRAAFIALPLAFVLCLPLFHFTGQLSAKWFLVPLGVLALTSAVLIGALSGTDVFDRNVNRFMMELGTVDSVMEGDLDTIEDSSWGLRVKFTVIGIEQFLERPLTGWGYKGSQQALADAADDGYLPKPYTQLHNSYLEALVDYGVGGLFIFLALFMWAFYRLALAGRSAQIKPEYLTGLFLYLMFLVVFSVFDGILFQERHGPLIFNIVMGLAVTHIYRDMLSPQKTLDL
tara:strand:+ start:1443 stop:2681 length:1239 start_codon:yes stop_codon:yes gene_type:complete